MGRKAKVGCLGVIAYCVTMSLVMHFAIGEGFFGARLVRFEVFANWAFMA